jgi:hypothetical protein
MSNKNKNKNKSKTKYDPKNPTGSKIIPPKFSILNKVITGIDKLTGFKRTNPLPDIPSDYNVPINPKGKSRYKYKTGGSVNISNFKGIF